MPLTRALRLQFSLLAWRRSSLAVAVRSHRRDYRLARSSAQQNIPFGDRVHGSQGILQPQNHARGSHSDGSIEASQSIFRPGVNGSRSVPLDAPSPKKPPVFSRPKGPPPRWDVIPPRLNPNLPPPRPPPSASNLRLQALQRRAADERARLLQEEWVLEEATKEDVPSQKQNTHGLKVPPESPQQENTVTSTREELAGTHRHGTLRGGATNPNLVGNTKRSGFPRHVNSTGISHSQTTLPEPGPSPPQPEGYSPEWDLSRQDVMREQWQAAAPDVTPRSLFEELFPEDRQEATKKAKERESVKLPAFSWEMDGKIEKDRQTAFGRHIKRATPIIPRDSPTPNTERPLVDAARQSREASVLVLSCALRSLEESDFFRLGPTRSEHIEGWGGGIIKVIPGRDNHSLQALGHYFILFSNVVSARAYMDNIFRLWKLANESTRHGAAGIAGFSFPPGFLKHGEDVQAIVKAFSLVPASTHLSLRLIEKPYKPAMLRLLSEEGRPPALKNSQSKTEDMVLLYTDFVNLSHYDVTKAIVEDGRRRNLHWKLAGGPDQVLALRSDEESTDDELDDMQRRPRRPQRFIISFKDRNEARRFARRWHQRPFPYSQTKRRIPGDEPPIVNAEILW